MPHKIANRLFTLLFLTAAVVGAPKDPQEEAVAHKAGIGPLLKERVGNELGIGVFNKEKSMIGSADYQPQLALSAESAAGIKNMRKVARPEAGRSADFDHSVTADSSEVEEGRANDFQEARPVSGKISLAKSSDLNEGGSSNEGTLFEWILNLWKSLRNRFLKGLDCLFCGIFFTFFLLFLSKFSLKFLLFLYCISKCLSYSTILLR
jgi:hypothetical protein